MNHAMAMRLIESVGNLDGVAKRFLDGERSLRNARRQILALQVFHHEIVEALVLAYVVHRADMRVAQRGHGASFALETLAIFEVRGEVWGQHLDRDGTIETPITRAVNFAHAAGADGRDDFVWS
jgi:hypothetical protein